jgi:hypothetical protein
MRSLRRRSIAREVATYGLIAGTVWFSWEVLKAPLADRAPPAIAIRLSPSSPEVLRRAAEVELQAGRGKNAADLANESLARAPFNARAMRVRGLVEAQSGNDQRADEILTLAGNWSLRDDPAHAWLVEHRLRRGDYMSSFAHADTLARRRSDLLPSLFRLFTTAVALDNRAMPALLRILAARPPWRGSYLDYLHEDDTGATVLASLAVNLERSNGRFNELEMQQLYGTWASRGQFAAIRQVRERLNRPPLAVAIQNSNFENGSDGPLYPFGWRLGGGPGLSISVLEDDLDEANSAARIEYDGFGSGVFADQLLMLNPGHYTLAGQRRTETPLDDMRVFWRIACLDGGPNILTTSRETLAAEDSGWQPFTTSFTVPAMQCSVQSLRLEASPGDRRTSIILWFDDLTIRSQTSRSSDQLSAGTRLDS